MSFYTNTLKVTLLIGRQEACVWTDQTPVAVPAAEVDGFQPNPVYVYTLLHIRNPGILKPHGPTPAGSTIRHGVGEAMFEMRP